MECHATVAWRVWRLESAPQPWRGFPWLGSKHVLSLVLRIKLREGTKLQLDTDAKFEKGSFSFQIYQRRQATCCRGDNQRSRGVLEHPAVWMIPTMSLLGSCCLNIMKTASKLLLFGLTSSYIGLLGISSK
nr:uncharacterized protein LOC117852988 isoform X1 [Setaria viridis]